MNSVSLTEGVLLVLASGTAGAFVSGMFNRRKVKLDGAAVLVNASTDFSEMMMSDVKELRAEIISLKATVAKLEIEVAECTKHRLEDEVRIKSDELRIKVLEEENRRFKLGLHDPPEHP